MPVTTRHAEDTAHGRRLDGGTWVAGTWCGETVPASEATTIRRAVTCPACRLAQIGTVGGSRGDERRDEIAAAIRLADQLEAHEPTTEVVTHFTQGSIRETVTRHGIAIPVAYAESIGGVSGVEAGTLVPGAQPLLGLAIGPGGGKRYSFRVEREFGVRRLAQDSQRPYTFESVLFIVEDPAWTVAWVDQRDRVDTQYTIVDAGGIHTFTPGWSEERDGGRRTQAWPGLPAGPAPDFGAMFPALRARAAAVAAALGPMADAVERLADAVESAASQPATPAQLAGLASKFNRR